MTEILGGFINIDWVGGYVNYSANGNSMILCNWLATFWEEEGGFAELKNKIGANCDFNTKLEMPSENWETTQKG